MKDDDWVAILKVIRGIGLGIDMIGKSPILVEGLNIDLERDPIERAEKLKEDIDVIYRDLENLVNNDNIPDKVRKYYQEAFRGFLLESYISSNITCTVAVEAALKERYNSHKFTLTFETQNKAKKIPKIFADFIEWGYQQKLIKTRRFADAMREVRNNVVHGDDEDYRDEAKQMIITMATLLNKIYS